MKKSIYLGLSLYAIGLVLFAFATESWMMFAFLIPYCLGGICGPSLQSVISGHVPSNQQGELQGALTSLMSVTTIIGPLLMNSTFAYFTTDKAPFYFPGIHFMIGAICMLMSIYITYKVLIRVVCDKLWLSLRQIDSNSLKNQFETWKSYKLMHPLTLLPRPFYHFH